MFSIKFAIYNYYIIVFNYERGHFVSSIIFGEDAISIESNIEWDDNCDIHEYWDSIDKQIRLRIPDKFLEANGWNL